MTGGDPFDTMEQEGADPFGAAASPDEEFGADLDQIDDGAPPGVYFIVCRDVRAATSRNNNPKFEFDFEVICDEKGSTEHQGWSDTVHCARTKAAMWKLEEVLVALGVCEPGTRNQLKFKRADVQGKVCQAAVETNTFNDRTRSQIGQVRRLPEGLEVPVATPDPKGDIPF